MSTVIQTGYNVFLLTWKAYEGDFWVWTFLPADLTRSELVDQQGTSLRFFPAIEAVQLSGHLIQLIISVVELGQELRVRPLHTNKKRHNKVILNAVTAIYDRSTDATQTHMHTPL